MADKQNPRILLITPEITYLPEGMGNLANYLKAKAGGLADVSASLVSTLYEKGLDVHVALPNYRSMFSRNVAKLINRELDVYRSKMPDDRIHLAEDRCFYYRDKVYDDHALENLRLAVAFQREVINNIMPRVQPDIIHCNDWMTGLLPAHARRLGIPTLFTVHNIHSMRATLAKIEDLGIDAAQFWPHLYYDRPPGNYEDTRETHRVDFLLSGLFSSTAINTVSPTFLEEIVKGRHSFINEAVVREFNRKFHDGYAVGVLNAPDSSYHPNRDPHIPFKYTAENHVEGKRLNKERLQHMLGLEVNPNAPMFFWPSRLDPSQKGCKLLGDIFYEVLSRYNRDRLQIVVIANGPYQSTLYDLVRNRDLRRRAVVCDFDEGLSRLGYAAADFILMPSSFEPCGLPQMIGPIYGTLPIAHDTGGIHDTVSNLSIRNNSGNGYLFEVHDGAGLLWAMGKGVEFHRLPSEVKSQQIARIMAQSEQNFSQDVNTRRYMDIYKHLLSKKKQT